MRFKRYEYAQNYFSKPFIHNIMCCGKGPMPNRFVSIPFYAVLAFFLIKKWRKKSIPIFIALILCIFLTDQSCNLIKHSVQRPRPSHDPVLSEQVHLVAKPDGTLYKGGPYGFPSSHAANSMALALWVIFYLGEKRKWLIMGMLCWVLLLSYSRIYLGVHYPSDLMVGWILGACWALVLWRGEQWLQNSKFRIQNS